MLHGLAQYVGRPGKEAARAIFTEALVSQLGGERTKNVQGYVARQLQVVGGKEAALSVGVPVRRIHALAWAVAGAVATVGGLFLAGFPNSPNPSLGDAALIAFPAIVLGGLDSPVGAVVGGVVIGVVQVLTAGYAPGWLGNNVDSVAPYVVMILVLLVRPYGLFGARPAVRL